MKNLTGKTIRITVRLNNLASGTVTYADFVEMPKIGDFLRNVQFKDQNPMSRNGTLQEILKVEEFYFGEWKEVV